MTYVATDLNRKITFRKLTLTQDPNTGEMIEAWADHVSVFARVEPLVGREYFAAAAVQAEDTTKFTMRYRGDITPDMRIAFDGDTYDIISIQNIRSGNRETLIYAKAAN
ncbi:phage head closure protein [uncultured Pigmentiphaga sp.]|uniref:phage head closure protein n=1 Tax=uncultured Pigmentiphaga sp. TaxID=340361 RepID=UPI002614321B|nr:phage head closure protein [uncultured Pigmentiphaga sp.]